MVSIKDVAKHANVAPSTVSKVINNYDNVSLKTKEKVFKAIDELDYVPNNIASSLSSKKLNRIALIINVNNQQSIDELNMQYLQGSFNRSQESKVDIVVIFSNMIENFSAIELRRYLQSYSIDGVIIYGMTKNDTIYSDLIASEKFYVIVIDACVINEKTSSVMIDHELMQYKVAKIIITNKMKKVLYLAGNKNGYVTDLRILGITKLSNEMNFKLDIYYADFSEKYAYHYVIENHDYDAIICASDLMAIGTNKALCTLGIQLPITGFDGINLLGYVDQDIYSVKQDFVNIGYTAIKSYEKLVEKKYGSLIYVDSKIIRIKYENIIF